MYKYRNTRRSLMKREIGISSGRILQHRRAFLGSGVAAAVLAAARPYVARAGREPNVTNSAAGVPPFELDETTIDVLAHGIETGRFTARTLVEKYLARIDA